MDTITEEAQPEEDARPEPDAKPETEPEARPEPEAVLQTGLKSTEQDAAPAERTAKGKPPLPSRARGARTAKREGTDAGKQALCPLSHLPEHAQDVFLEDCIAWSGELSNSNPTSSWNHITSQAVPDHAIVGQIA